MAHEKREKKLPVMSSHVAPNSLFSTAIHFVQTTYPSPFPWRNQGLRRSKSRRRSNLAMASGHLKLRKSSQ